MKTARTKLLNQADKFLLQELKGHPVFLTKLKLKTNELQHIKEITEHQWLKRIQEILPKQAEKFQQIRVDFICIRLKSFRFRGEDKYNQ